MSPPTFYSTYQVAAQPPSANQSRKWKETCLAASYFHGKLDRVNVLGDDTTGHTGCVNALSWGKGGEVLVSSGDDTNIRLWRMDRSNVDHAYPFVCDTIINTGHRANVFNAQMLPHSSRIATVAGDRQVRVFDCEKGAGRPRHTGEMEYSTSEAVVRVIRCHDGRVKRIVTEDSPDLFLTVAEDGTVRQHDLRVPHSCRAGSCPAPLVRLSHELSSISLSPLTPYQFVVAGSSPYGYLFDRRHAGRQFHEEWGRPPADDELTTCVRKFGRDSRGHHERRGTEHVTGTRMASSNGHEVLLSYSADAIYLYSTRDDPQSTSIANAESAILQPNKKQSSRTKHSHSPETTTTQDMLERDTRMEEDIERIFADSTSFGSPEENTPLLDGAMDENEDDIDDDMAADEEDESEDEESIGDQRYSNVPVVMPRARFAGVCNVETVKDVNFIGPRDEFIVSGSDDGHWFMWEKDTGRLHDILEGDGSVVNVIEGHPHLPLVAVSGIDHSVKLFASTPTSPSHFSRMDRAESIIKRNDDASAPRRRSISQLLMYYRLARRMADEGAEQPECTFQ